MATKRKLTENLVVLAAGTRPNASEFMIATKYREQGVLGIGSHYLITEFGEVTKHRPSDEHGNVHPDFNKNSIFIEVIGTVDTYRTSEAQQGAVRGIIDYLQDTYYGAEELDWTS